MTALLARLPLFLILAAISCVAMMVPALHALLNDDHTIARSFLYYGLIGLAFIALVCITLSARPRHSSSDLANLLGLFLTFTLLPVFLALPFYEGLGTTAFVNAYIEMVSC